MQEKLDMGRRRQEQLTTMNSFYSIKEVFDYKIEAEKRFGSFLMLPLDIPVIKDDLFVDWYWENAKKVKKIIPDIATSRNDLESFISVDFINKDSDWLLNTHNFVWSSNYVKNFDELFPKLHEQLYEYFPFKLIENYSIWSSTEPIGLHRDRSGFADYPSSMRIMLHDENPNPTLFVEEYAADSVFPEIDTFRYIPRISDSNSFVWNNLRTKHGSDHNPNYRKILLIFKHCIVDWKKYFDLLERSISKYSTQCLQSKLDINSFVHPVEPTPR